MNFLSRIADMLRRQPAPPSAPAPGPSTLRNRVGGLAWVRIVDDLGTGAGEMNGRIVTTERLLENGAWAIAPLQTYTAARQFITPLGQLYFRGDVAIVFGMADDLLQPIPDTGITAKEVAALYAASPVKTKGQPA